MYSLFQQRKIEGEQAKSEKHLSRNKYKRALQTSKKEHFSESSKIRIQNFSRDVTPELEKGES